MIKYLRAICFGVLLLAMGSFFPLKGQEQTYTPKQGLEYIKAGDFESAEPVYAHLLRKYPRDGAYNFYMGICLLNNKGDLSQSIKMLNYARIKKVSRKVYYYLGRAHQKSFHFEEAISNFEHFLKFASKGDPKIEKTHLFLEQCKSSRRISSKIYELSVMDKSKVLKSQLLEMYYPAKDVGKLRKNSDFFESGVNPDNVMFETERGDVVYFSMAASSEDTLSIYKMEKLLDGWGDNESIGTPVNSVYNDAYPFMETDGLTFYFASDRPGGFGGFDIYKIYYDNESQSFLDPINMGVPFNSPDDDFLFVSDEFNQVAWFASNRETKGDTVLVYTVKWDGNQVRNMAEDANQISRSAKLLIDETKGVQNSRKDDFTYRKNKSRFKSNGLFRFQVNDTLTYTDFDHFLNTEALSLYRSGYEMEQDMDSLAYRLKTQRAAYDKVTNESERNEIVNEILLLEKLVYNLEDDIHEKYILARQKETQEILSRKEKGVYRPAASVSKSKPETLNFEGVFVPEKYSFHTTNEFVRHYAKQEEMYKKMFSENDVATLKYADSLYVWANIINLESARLLEQSATSDEQETVKLSDLIKKRQDSLNGQEGESNASRMIKNSKELKLLSTRIYHKAMDKKFPVYYLKLKDVSKKLNESNSKQILLLSQQGNAFYREAKDVLSGPGGLNMESYEKAGTLKKAGIEKQEKALRIYSQIDSAELKESSGGAYKENKKESKGVVQKSYAEIHKGTDAIGAKKETKKSGKKVEEEKATAGTTKPITEGVFKIQMGVFKNPPKQEALSQIKEVSKQEIEGRGLTKYFAGNYKTYEEAKNALSSVIDAGFTGAFVVYFKDGKQSTLPKK